MDSYLAFLVSIMRMPRTFQSNHARNSAKLVAEAASRGHITCLCGKAKNTGVWQITSTGTKLLKEYGRIV